MLRAMRMDFAQPENIAKILPAQPEHKAVRLNSANRGNAIVESEKVKDALKIPENQSFAYYEPA